jgi:hypothetical protein
MRSKNPYEAPKSPVADVAAAPKRPLPVGIALVILWTVLAIWALGALAQVTATAGAITGATWGYIAYLVTLTVLPAWLLVRLGQARGRARVALMAVYGIDILFRIYLLDFGSFLDVLVGIMAPAACQAVAFIMLHLPASNAWFRSRA